MTIELNEQWTGIAALLTILLGARINRAVPVFSAYSIPPAVTGGLLIALLLAIAGATLQWKVTFAETLRNALLLIFFAALGLTARFRRLKTGGAAVAGLCVLIALLATLQSAAGAAIAQAFGRPPALGVFLGSVPFLGGHGTTVAWAQSPLASGLPHALEIGMVCATIGLVAGAVISGVVGTRLAKRAARGSAAAAERRTGGAGLAPVALRLRPLDCRGAVDRARRRARTRARSRSPPGCWAPRCRRSSRCCWPRSC